MVKKLFISIFEKVDLQAFILYFSLAQSLALYKVGQIFIYYFNHS